MKSASHHHHAISLPGTVDPRGAARIASSSCSVGAIIAEPRVGANSLAIVETPSVVAVRWLTRSISLLEIVSAIDVAFSLNLLEAPRPNEGPP